MPTGTQRVLKEPEHFSPPFHAPVSHLVRSRRTAGMAGGPEKAAVLQCHPAEVGTMAEKVVNRQETAPSPSRGWCEAGGRRQRFVPRLRACRLPPMPAARRWKEGRHVAAVCPAAGEGSAPAVSSGAVVAVRAARSRRHTRAQGRLHAA